MQYADLSPYRYQPELARPGLLNVGWLGSRVDRRAAAEEAAALATALAPFVAHPVGSMRGFHSCQIDECAAMESHPDWPALGHFELRVFGPGDVHYACPGLLVHYVSTHRYWPPDDFVAAVRTGPQPGDERYATLLAEHSRYVPRASVAARLGGWVRKVVSR